VTGALDDTVGLLHTAGYLYGQHGQTRRAIAILMIAARLAPGHVGVLRTLAYTFLIDGAPQRAIAIMERLRAMEGGDHPALDLLESRALWACGRESEARAALDQYMLRPR
jgi:type III secretion protein Y